MENRAIPLRQLMQVCRVTPNHRANSEDAWPKGKGSCNPRSKGRGWGIVVAPEKIPQCAKKKLSFWGGDGRGKVEEILEHPGEVEETLKQTYGTGGGGCPGTQARLQTVQTKEDALLQRDASYGFS